MTSRGERILQGDTPYGVFRVEWDANGNLINEHIEIRSPDQAAPVTSPQTPNGITPCSILKAAIHKITGATPCGQCNEHCKEMDAKGWWWCWTHRKIIAGWLCESAHKRADDLERAAKDAAAQAKRARQAADAIDPDRALSLLKAAIRELKPEPTRRMPARSATTAIKPDSTPL